MIGLFYKLLRNRLRRQFNVKCLLRKAPTAALPAYLSGFRAAPPTKTNVLAGLETPMTQNQHEKYLER